MRHMDKREERIVDAAIGVFSRYGVQRTTMNDIAAEAGLVRQTLYNVFANKEEILRAAIRLHSQRALAAIKQDCDTTPDLGDRLDIAFRHLIAEPFRIIQESPHADEILTGFRAAALQELKVADQHYRDMLKAVLEPYVENLGTAGITLDALADLILKCWYGFKLKADKVAQLWALQASLKILVLSVALGR